MCAFMCVCVCVCVCTAGVDGNHAVLRDDFDSNLDGELDTSIWYIPGATPTVTL